MTIPHLCFYNSGSQHKKVGSSHLHPPRAISPSHYCHRPNTVETLPDTNSEFTPENQWLEDYPSSHNHGSVEYHPFHQRKLILEIHPFPTFMIMVGKLNFLLAWPIFRGYVDFVECMISLGKDLPWLARKKPMFLPRADTFFGWGFPSFPGILSAMWHPQKRIKRIKTSKILWVLKGPKSMMMICVGCKLALIIYR